MMLLLLLIQCFMLSDSPGFTDNLRIDFGHHKEGQNWQIINDGVMGGLSQGEGYFTDTSLVYKGVVSLDNNGGFSSFRCPFQQIDLSSYEVVKIRYKSTGIAMAFCMETERPYYKPNYKKGLPNTIDGWETITLVLKEFKAYRLGQEMDWKLKQETLSEIIRIGFITNEKKYGPFQFEIDYIEFS